MPADDDRLSRRTALKTIGTAAAGSLAVIPGTVSASPESEYESEVTEVMDDFDIKGVSVAVVPGESSSSGGSAYQDAFGINKVHGSSSYRRYREPLDTSHRLRLASVSKLLTSTAIMELVEAGTLSLDDQVFGSNGILPESEYGSLESGCPLTISDLLNHDYDFEEDEDRPVYEAPLDANLQETIKFVNDNYTLRHYTTSFGGQARQVCYGADYHNYGYGVLGAVVEETLANGFVGGSTFERFVNHRVLPVGSKDMDTVESSHGAVENEGYHHSDSGDPYSASTVRHRAWAWAAWAGTPHEVANFGQSVMNGWQYQIDDFTDVLDYGWHDYRHGSTDYVGHSGAQTGVRAALRCRPERSLCVMLNTRHADEWPDEDGPLTQLVLATYDLAEELF